MMNEQTLGGTIFCYNAISQDYCLEEAVESLKALCDEVIVLDAGSTDGSDKLVKSFEDKKTKTICLPNEEWVKFKGRNKLAHFTNVAISSLSTDWNFNLQADEINCQIQQGKYSHHYWGTFNKQCCLLFYSSLCIAAAG